MDPFFLKRGDTLPYLVATLSDDSGPVDLTGATVKFVLRQSRTRCATGEPALLLKKDAVVADPASGVVRYEWASGDTDTAGQFDGEFEVTFPSGGRWTFPSSGYIPVNIGVDLG